MILIQILEGLDILDPKMPLSLEKSFVPNTFGGAVERFAIATGSTVDIDLRGRRLLLQGDVREKALE